MKRLTEYTIPETGFSVVSEEKYKRILMEEKPSVEKVYNRLKKIEDILGDEYDLDEIREMVQAKREGRCVVLPDKTKTPTLERGTPVWYVDYENKNTESGKIFLASYKEGKLDSFSVDFDCGDFDEFIGSAWGDCFFGSKEQAETALKAREQDG